MRQVCERDRDELAPPLHSVVGLQDSFGHFGLFGPTASRLLAAFQSTSAGASAFSPIALGALPCIAIAAVSGVVVCWVYKFVQEARNSKLAKAEECEFTFPFPRRVLGFEVDAE